MKRIISCLTVLLSCTLAFCSEEIDVENCLRSIFSSDFGYTLLGEKPVSLDDSHDWYLDYKPEVQKPVTAFLTNVFKDSNTFVFKSRGWFGKVLINLKALSRQISRYKKLRRFVKQKFGSEENFFNILKDPSLGIFDLLDRDEILLAIVFGYGEENGDFYTRRVLVGHYLKKYPLYSVYPFQQKPGPLKIRGWKIRFRRPELISKPDVRPQFGSLEEEWAWIRAMENSYVLRKDPKHCEPYYLYLPHYVSRRGPQSDEIYANFLLARDRLAKLFCGRKFSEVIAEEAARK